MKRIAILISVMAVAFCAACNQVEAEAPNLQSGKAPAAQTANAGMIPAADGTASAGEHKTCPSSCASDMMAKAGKDGAAKEACGSDCGSDCGETCSAEATLASAEGEGSAKTDGCSDAGCGGCDGEMIALASKDAGAKPVAGEKECLKGTTIALESGEKAVVFCVSDFEGDLDKLAGLIAIEGKVSTVYADKGAFILVDCEKEPCPDGCCPMTEVPVRIALDKFEGSMPEVESEVLVVGELTLTETGYNLSVLEVRQGENVLLKPETVSV